MMETGLLGQIGIGACIALTHTGAAFGTGVVVSAIIGAWKKCYILNKPPPFILVYFASVPLSQPIYSFVLANVLANSTKLNSFQLLGFGVFAGIALGVSTYTQAKAAACAVDAFTETEQGFGLYVMILGFCETVALFVMVFSMLFA